MHFVSVEPLDLGINLLILSFGELSETKMVSSASIKRCNLNYKLKYFLDVTILIIAQEFLDSTSIISGLHYNYLTIILFSTVILPLIFFCLGVLS